MADGQVWSVDEYEAEPDSHPNCGRSASAISTDEARERGVDRGDDPPDTPDQPADTALTDLPDTSEVTQDE